MRVLLLLIGSTTLLRAQTPAPVAAAAATVTPEEIARYVRVLAADSFQPRTTPSPALERTARYVAAQFAQLGLVPAGDQIRKLDSTGQPYRGPDGLWATDTAWFQRYPLPGQQRPDYAESRLTFAMTLTRHGKPVVTYNPGAREVIKDVTIDFRTVGRLATEVTPRLSVVGQGARAVTLLSGHHTPASVRNAKLHDQVVLYVWPQGGDSAEQSQVLAQLAADNDVVLLHDDDSAHFARRRAASLVHPPTLVDAYLRKAIDAPTWGVEVRPDAMCPVLAAAGLDWDTVRAASAPTVQPLPFTRARFDVAVAPPDSASAVVTAPNVVGILRGTGVKIGRTQNYQGFYVVLSAAIDDRNSSGVAEGGTTGGARIAGLAGLLALAQAFSQPGMRPHYSILFVATSGRAPGPWGSSYVTNDREDLVAHLELDGLGRPAGDSLWLDGLQDLEFAESPAWVLAAHPELGLTVVADDGSSEQPTDHDVFVRHAVPSLRWHGVATGAAPADLDYAARVVRAALYVAGTIANAAQPPHWTAAGRRRFLESGTP